MTILRALDCATQLAADLWSYAYHRLDGLRPESIATARTTPDEAAPPVRGSVPR